jgi:hypothetical protein
MRVFGNSSLRMIFGPKWEEVTGEVHKEYDQKTDGGSVYKEIMIVAE